MKILKSIDFKFRPHPLIRVSKKLDDFTFNQITFIFLSTEKQEKNMQNTLQAEKEADKGNRLITWLFSSGI